MRRASFSEWHGKKFQKVSPSSMEEKPNELGVRNHWLPDNNRPAQKSQTGRTHPKLDPSIPDGVDPTVDFVPFLVHFHSMFTSHRYWRVIRNNRLLGER
jgi:hypothetical protein